jgi:hypothetical protein
MFEYKHRHQGLIRTIIIIVIALIVLGFFGFNVRNIIQGETVQDNLHYAKELAITVWQKYLSKPILYFWNNIFLKILWDAFITNMERIKNGEQTEEQRNAPMVPKLI